MKTGKKAVRNLLCDEEFTLGTVVQVCKPLRYKLDARFFCRLLVCRPCQSNECNFGFHRILAEGFAYTDGCA